EAEPGASVTAAPEALELLKYPCLLLLAETLALVGYDKTGPVPILLHAQPNDRSLWRIADGVADEVEHDLQHPTELGDSRSRLSGLGRVQSNAALLGAHPEYAGGTASHVGQVDAVRRGREMFVLDY